MNRIQSTLLGIMALATTFTACTKEEHHHGTEASITITAPTELQEFDHAATVHLTGTVTATEELHGYQLIVRRKSDNAEQYTKEAHAHGTHISFDETWVNNINSTQDMELEVIAILDHDGNTISKKVDFRCEGL